jgi:NADPH-dependent curcumin reductase CurA
LCRAVYSAIDPDLREFMHKYQEYVSKKNVHELLDRLSQSVTKTEEGV